MNGTANSPERPREAPREPTGRILAELPRYGGDLLRVSLETYQDHPHIGLRVFTAGPDGRPRPTHKGCSIRVKELDGVLKALTEAKRLVEAEDPRRQGVAQPSPNRLPKGQRPDVRDMDLPPAGGHSPGFSEFDEAGS